MIYMEKEGLGSLFTSPDGTRSRLTPKRDAAALLALSFPLLVGQVRGNGPIANSQLRVASSLIILPGYVGPGAPAGGSARAVGRCSGGAHGAGMYSNFINHKCMSATSTPRADVSSVMWLWLLRASR